MPRCYICHNDDTQQPLLLEPEFDTHVHLECLRITLTDNPDDIIAGVIAASLNMGYDEYLKESSEL